MGLERSTLRMSGFSSPWRSAVFAEKAPPPLFFVSVASKRLSQAVSLLFATLAGRSVSVAAKGLKGGGVVTLIGSVQPNGRVVSAPVAVVSRRMLKALIARIESAATELQDGKN